MKYRVIFNPLAANSTGAELVKKVPEHFPAEDEFTYADITRIDDIYAYLESIPEEEKIIIAGGDGTINCLINTVGKRALSKKLYYHPLGSGNDFFADVKTEDNELIELNKYIKNLPTVTVNGKTSYFLNGIGYGIDGYCCEVGDKQRAEDSTKKINYTSIAIKGLLFHYKPVNAKVTVDGVVKEYHKVWLAPTMNGRYYGGGMKVAPEQNRLNDKKELSVVIMYGSGKIKTLVVFPGIFEGKHVAHTEMVDVLTGHNIKVEFDNPTALQIDGETVLGVTSYEVKSAE